MVPERASEMAAHGDEAGKQNGGENVTRWVPRDGHVPRADGVHPVAASTQSALQRDGGPAESEFHGLSIATVLRLMSALQLSYIIRSVFPLEGLMKRCGNRAGRYSDGIDHIIQYVVKYL